MSWCQGFAGEVNDPLRVGFFIGRTLGGYQGGVVEVSSWEMVLFSWDDWVALCLGECLQPCLTDLVGLLDWPAWGLLLPSLGGRRAVAWHELLPSEGRWADAGRALLPSPVGRRAVAWEKLLPSQGRWAVAGRDLLPSPGGRWAMARGRLWLAPAWLLVIVWETKLLDQIVAIALVIFPCFLLIRLLNLFSCLCLTLVNLISLTLSMKPWHSLSFSAEMIEANWVLQSSVCLATWSKMLLMALTLAWSKSFSAFLMICLALDVFRVDLSLMLTGTKSLWRHLRVKILWFL